MAWKSGSGSVGNTGGQPRGRAQRQEAADDDPGRAMRMRRRLVLGIGATTLVLLGLLSWAVGGRVASALVQAGVATSYDIVYRRVGDRELKLDVARPAKGGGPFPVLILLHGGGWCRGSKESLRFPLAAYAARGYVAVAPQYRFWPGDVFPAQVHDAKDAVRWVKAHAHEHHGDPGRVGVIGTSAGGHLAMMLGMTGPEDGLEGDAPAGAPGTAVQAVVSLVGPSDLTADDFPKVTRDLIAGFLGGPASERPDVAAKASPVSYVSRGDAPTLAFLASGDPIVPSTQGAKMSEALARAGVPGRVVIVRSKTHGLAGEDQAKATAETFQFLDTYVRQSAP
jgi:acetyl esterase/lipase